MPTAKQMLRLLPDGRVVGLSTRGVFLQCYCLVRLPEGETISYVAAQIESSEGPSYQLADGRQVPAGQVLGIVQVLITACEGEVDHE
jgi:hypothetical protein